MKVTERRIVEQHWYEDTYTIRGWDSHGWVFKDDYQGIVDGWEIVDILDMDKFYHPILAIAEKETEIK